MVVQFYITLIDFNNNNNDKNNDKNNNNNDNNKNVYLHHTEK